jgi:hypothetical protein
MRLVARRAFAVANGVVRLGSPDWVKWMRVWRPPKEVDWSRALSNSRVPEPVSGPVFPWPVRVAVGVASMEAVMWAARWRVPFSRRMFEARSGLSVERRSVPPPDFVRMEVGDAVMGWVRSSWFVEPSTWMCVGPARVMGLVRVARLGEVAGW